MTRPSRFPSLCLALWACAATVSGADLSESIEAIRSVGPEGHGNAAAGAAWAEVARAEVDELPILLAGMDGANELAMNWLRAAVDTVVDRAAAQGNALPVSALKDFVEDRSHNPMARRLAYELIAAVDSEAASQLLDGMLDDPSMALRREAVQRLIASSDAQRSAGATEAAIAVYGVALKSARDVDQIESIAKSLDALGAPVQLPEVFGWLTRWQVIAPFDNTGGAGYDRVFPPEESVDLGAELEGTSGNVNWQELIVADDYGKVDLNKPFGGLKEVTGYAWTEFHSDSARLAELRLASKNGWKLWLNGELLFGRDEYHSGTEIDHYRMAAELKKGVNTILVKLCQNELTADWAKEWEFQLRVTDPVGTPIVSAK